MQIPKQQTYQLSSVIPKEQGVTFDPDTIVIQGIYTDELSLQRAKRCWSECLLQHFLLDKDQDFSISSTRLGDSGMYYLACYFLSASGRYAFWRITNYQAAEAQYIIETAHIPPCQSRREEILQAPDLRCIHDEPNHKNLYNNIHKHQETTQSIISALRGIVKALIK